MKENKKIWKLLELLNEFRPTVSCANFKEHYEFIDDDIYLIREWMDGDEEQFPMYICYKKGDFVKWLVENDKIDQKGIEYKFQDVLFELEEEEIVKEKSDFLIMLLSISDTPIEDLISYLK